MDPECLIDCVRAMTAEQRARLQDAITPLMVGFKDSADNWRVELLPGDAKLGDDTLLAEGLNNLMNSQGVPREYYASGPTGLSDAQRTTAQLQLMLGRQVGKTAARNALGATGPVGGPGDVGVPTVGADVGRMPRSRATAEARANRKVRAKQGSLSRVDYDDLASALRARSSLPSVEGMLLLLDVLPSEAHPAFRDYVAKSGTEIWEKPHKDRDEAAAKALAAEKAFVAEQQRRIRAEMVADLDTVSRLEPPPTISPADLAMPVDSPAPARVLLKEAAFLRLCDKAEAEGWPIPTTPEGVLVAVACDGERYAVAHFAARDGKILRAAVAPADYDPIP